MAIKTTDVDTEITVETGIDLSEATVIELVLKTPTGDYVVLDDSDLSVFEITKIRHIKTLDTFNIAGPWQLEAFAQWASGRQWTGNPTTVNVSSTIRDEME